MGKTSCRDKILVIGESCMDVFCYGRVERLCPEAPAPVFNPVAETRNPGMAKNVQKNVESLGGICELYTNQNWENVTKTRYVHNNTNQMFVRVDKNDDKIERSERLDEIEYKKYGLIIISDYNKGFLTEEDILKISSKHDNVFLDTKKKLGSWCRNVNFIKINNYEFNKARDLIDEHIRGKLIVTLGKDGCLFQEKTYSVKEVEIKDVSGAGDTFISALAVEYDKSRNIEKAIVFANECATKVVQKKGVSTI